MSTAAVFLLGEQANLSTSNKVSALLPRYPAGEKIGVGQLHTFGVPNVNVVKGDGRVHHTTERLIVRVKDRPLDFEPGSRMRYSNSC